MTMRRLLPILLLAGCSFFSRSQSKFYSLDRIPPATPVAPTRVVGVPIAIDGIELPPGADRREVVVRQADHQLQVRSAEQWTASLQPLVLHTLAFDLAARLPEGMVILPGAVRPAGAARSVDVVLEELGAGPTNVVVLDGRWSVHESGRASQTHHERITVDVASLDSVNVATGMSQALGMLADRMAAQLAR
ncbi:MAG TPA: PqiC family protein [Thermoanaerobaculia bacterium]|jgi:uncharacterized lipoprotein YmbA|nr:PqiC family protein [Thermoanaerobaculia bacterium]